MTDEDQRSTETPPAGADSNSGASGAAGTPPAGAAATAPVTTPASDADAVRDAEKKALSEEAAKYRRELRAAQDRLQKLEEAQMSEAEKRDAELERLREERTTWEREKREMRARETVTQVAQRLGIIDPDAAYVLCREKLEYDQDHTPTNAEGLLRDMLKTRSWLKGTPASTTNPARETAAVSDAEARHKARNNPTNIWDMSYATNLGGGVHWPDKDKKQ